MEEAFGGDGLTDCCEFPTCEQIIICEHSLDFYKCKICLNKPIQKQKSTL